MTHWKVRDVMTTDVASVGMEASYKEIVDLLAERRISAVPVVGAAGRVVGVVSEADLLHKVELEGERDHLGLFDTRRRREALEKAAADDAGQLMSSPPVTVSPRTSLVAAAKLMEHKRVKRLPVVDENGRLVGVVSRGDLLRVFLRPDLAIREEVVERVLRRALWTGPPEVEVEVREGVVTLVGELERRSLIPIALRLTSTVDGVVDVVDRLTYQYDDTDDLRRVRSMARRGALPAVQ
jgi:CBS domain-containing protein